VRRKHVYPHREKTRISAGKALNPMAHS